MTTDHADDGQDRASSENLQETFGPPGAALPTRVLDLVITTTDRSHEAPEDEYERNPPATQDGPIDLGFGVRLEELHREDAELVLNACSPRGHFFIPVRQFGQRYTYVFERATDEATATSTHFDPEQRLNAAIQLSRLVRENSDSMQYGARLVVYEDGSRMVIPFPDFELGRAYALVRGRDWMTRDEANQLRTLLSSYWEVSDGLPPGSSARLDDACISPRSATSMIA